MTIIIYIDGKYALFYYVKDLVGAAAKVQTLACNKAACMQTPYNRARAYYNLITISNFYLELINQLVQNSYILVELARCSCTLPVY